MNEPITAQVRTSQSYAMQIRIEAMLITMLKMQAKIISNQEGRPFDEVFNQYAGEFNDAVLHVAEKVTANTSEGK